MPAGSAITFECFLVGGKVQSESKLFHHLLKNLLGYMLEKAVDSDDGGETW
jgi:hypothetical protein